MSPLQQKDNKKEKQQENKKKKGERSRLLDEVRSISILLEHFLLSGFPNTLAFASLHWSTFIDPGHVFLCNPLCRTDKGNALTISSFNAIRIFLVCTRLFLHRFICNDFHDRTSSLLFFTLSANTNNTGRVLEDILELISGIPKVAYLITHISPGRGFCQESEGG